MLFHGLKKKYKNTAKDGDLDTEGVFKCLYERAPPPPNQSTQTQPLSNTDFIYQVDFR